MSSWDISTSAAVSSRWMSTSCGPTRPTHPKGRSRNMSLSGYQIGPREPVRYKKRTSDRSAGFVVKGKKGLHFLIGLRGKYHRAPDGRLHQNLIRATGYSVQ